MIERLSHRINSLSEHIQDRLILGLALAYFSLLSYGIYRGITTIATIRVAQALNIGWGVLAIFVLAIAGLAWRRPGWLSRTVRQVLAFIARLPVWVKTVLFLLVVSVPIPLILTRLSRGLLEDEWLRLSMFIFVILAGVLLVPFQNFDDLRGRLALTMLSMALLLMASQQFSFVTNYPFSIGWSEGNRFYDYSLIFGQRLYQHAESLSIPYGSPGRYGLWGIWFLFDGLPIAFHRAWNAVLWFLPSLLFGWFALQHIDRPPVRLVIALWIVLFLNQGPIYAPLLIAAFLVVLPMHSKNPWKRAAFLALAAWYVGLSRWTWSIIPGVWGALIDLYLYHPQRSGSWVRRLLPTLGLGLAGSLPGILVNLNRILAPKETTLSFSQPLLWERLLPNPTYEPGILLGLAIAVLPLLLLAAWVLISGRLQLNGLQALASAGAALAFLAAGIVASTKIGGGSNLHNLDMFLVTLALLASLWLARMEDFSPGGWTGLGQLLLALLVFLPAYPILSEVSRPDPLPGEQTVSAALEAIQTQVEIAQAKGEVLFMDQRQLLTFGAIQGVDLIPEYEKKYVMDQAMAGNQAYFDQFYQDLKDKRFALIVSERLFKNMQDETYGFAAENNAWVKWVSRPLLCYYRPKSNLREVGVQLLVPRGDPEDCPAPGN